METIIKHTADGCSVQTRTGVEIGLRPTLRQAIDLQYRIQDIVQDQIAELIEREDSEYREFLKSA